MRAQEDVARIPEDERRGEEGEPDHRDGGGVVDVA